MPLLTEVDMGVEVKKSATVAERIHMGKVASQGCVLCRHLGADPSPAEVHHIREGQGMSQRASHFLTIPLCPEHHRGNNGIHGLGAREFERRYKLDELDLLAMTIEGLSE